MIPIQYALRRRMMINVNKGLPISDLPLGALINVGTDGGAGTPNYEIADKDNLVSGGVVLVRKSMYSNSKFGSTRNYPNDTLDNLIKTTIYNKMPQKLQDKMMDATFALEGSDSITRKMFALTFTMVGFGNNSGVAEGKALQLYTGNASRIKTFNDSASVWWLSSRHSSGNVWCVGENGYASYGNPLGVLWVVPAFVLPLSVQVEADADVNGVYNLAL